MSRVAGETSAWLKAVRAGLCLAVWALAMPIQAQPAPDAAGSVPEYSLQAASDGGGAILLSPQQASYPSNTAVTVTAVPDSGWVFLGWLGDLQGTEASKVVRMTRDKCVQAVFGTALLLSANGEGSASVSPALPHYPFGSFCRISVLPEGGYYFSGWSGEATGDLAPLVFQVTKPNPAVVASFARLDPGQLALSLRAVGGGSVTVNPFRANRYNSGQFVQIIAIAEAGQDFLEWSGNASGSESPLDLLMDGNKVITATFTDRPHLSVGPCLGGLTEDGFQLTVESLLGGVFEIDWTAEFNQWTPLLKVTNTLGKVQTTDPGALGQPHRFYRAQSVP